MNLIYTSIIASIAIVFCIIIRALSINKMPKKVFKILWMLVLVRLIFPKLPSFKLTLFQNVPLKSPDILNRQNELIPQGIAGISPEASHVANKVTSHQVFTAIWLVGFILITLLFTLVYMQKRKKFSSYPNITEGSVSQWVDNNVHLKRQLFIKYSSEIKSPLTYGVLKPTILLPSDIEGISHSHLNYILMHEYIHIKTFDGLLKQIALLAVCLHWFNPLCWAMLVLINRDIELACDEAVIKTFDLDNRSDYALTLVNFEEIKTGMFSVTNNFSINALEERIVAIMKCKKTNKYIIGVATLCIMSTAALTLTNYEVGAAAANNLKLSSLTSDVVSAQDSDDGMMSKLNENGEWVVSEDGGKTWVPESSLAMLDSVDVTYEWYTLEEYAQYLEDSKKILNEMLADQSLIDTTDDSSALTQKDVDTIVADMEDTLNRIKNGEKISKPVEGVDGMAGMPENGIASFTD